MKSVIAECSACKGTGIYIGYAERDGFGVVCSLCKGTGKVEIKYTEFTGIKKAKNVKFVVLKNPGIGIGGNDPEKYGAISYTDFVKGKMPYKEMRAFTCPAWWYQAVDYSKKPNWDECISCGSFSNCSMFKHKEKCWEKFDSEVKK
jgi:hypothetical protein